MPRWNVPLLLLSVILLRCASPPSETEEDCTEDEILCKNRCVPRDEPCDGAGGATEPADSSTDVDGTADAAAVDAGLSSEDPESCADTATVNGTLNQQYQTVPIQVSGQRKSYYLTTNWWHVYDGQSIQFDGLSFEVIDPNDVSVPPSDGAPTGYPALFIGSYGGNTSTGSNLPKAVSEITSIPTVLSTNAVRHGTDNTNAAYDVWFTRSAGGVPPGTYHPGTGGVYLMVWLYKPIDRQPRGGIRNSPNHPNREIQGVEGEWDVWLDPSTGYPPCVSYVSATPREELAFDLADFIRDALANNYFVTEEMYLSIIFAGFEIWGNGDGLKLENFCVDVR